jgi:hypothetical protein
MYWRTGTVARGVKGEQMRRLLFEIRRGEEVLEDDG